MRVSIINLNLEGPDAIGQSILNQTRFFQRRGDELQIYLAHPARNVPDAVKSLVRVVNLTDLGDRRDPYFPRSDLYVYHYPSRYSLLESIKTLERGAVIFYYHNVTPPDLWGSCFDQDVLRDSVASVGAFANYADLIVTPSAFNASQLVQQYNLDRDRIRVLPLAVALDQFKPGPKDAALLERYNLYGKRTVLFVGRMAGNKRIDLLVEALSQVRLRVPDAILMLVGDDQGNPAIQESVSRARARAGELGIAEHVIFTGVVDELPAYYRLADVYVTASLHEGFGVPLIEAMASGVPVVASRVTAHPEVVGEAGLLTEPGDASDLAGRVIEVLTDDALCGELVQRGLARAREFSLEQYETSFGRIVSEATAWLPGQPYPRLRSISTRDKEKSPDRDAEPIRLASLEQLKASADIMLRSYVVRSRMPALGPLIAWIRRNLTSHLREPYLDPTLERQVAFNQGVVPALEMLAMQLAECRAEQSKLETRLDLLAGQVSRLELDPSQDLYSERLGELNDRIEELRGQLERDAAG